VCPRTIIHWLRTLEDEINPGAVHVGLVVGRVALGKGVSARTLFFSVFTIPVNFRIYSSNIHGSVKAPLGK
jgi:hypothetical protein